MTHKRLHVKTPNRRGMSLRQKIFCGFAVMISLFLFNSGFGLLGLHNTRVSFDTYRQAESTNNIIVQINRDVQELMGRVTQYIFTGNNSHRDQAVNLASTLKERIAEVAPEIHDSSMRELLDSMLAHLVEYSNKFELVTEERHLRSELAGTALPESEAVVQGLLKELSHSFSDENATSRNRVTILSAQRSFSTTVVNALRYFGSPDSAFANTVAESLRSVRNEIEKLQFKEGSPNLQKKNELIDALNDYERVCFRAIQATRGYLYYVNVVMAGEASEFTYDSTKLKQMADLRRSEIGKDAVRVSYGIRNVTCAVIFVGVIATAFLSGHLAYLVVPPITELTNTFRRLAEGETLLSLPQTDRGDEIGEMALAAQVFNKRNQETQELLERSRELSAELTQKADELVDINAELDNFAYIASHDLKSPLRGINQLATWVEEDVGDQLPEESRVHLEKLRFRVRKMEIMLQDMLDYSRIGRSQEQTETVDTRSMLCEVVELLENPGNIEIRINPDLPVFSTCRIPFEQVFLNLITNAIKHHDHPESGTICVDVTEQPDFYEFVVSDDGPGIPDGQHERIFQMYQRVGNPNVDGSGMGLAIVKKQIGIRGGEIHVHSEAGKGAEFRFTWPKGNPANQEALTC